MKQTQLLDRLNSFVPGQYECPDDFSKPFKSDDVRVKIVERNLSFFVFIKRISYKYTNTKRTNINQRLKIFLWTPTRLRFYSFSFFLPDSSPVKNCWTTYNQGWIYDVSYKMPTFSLKKRWNLNYSHGGRCYRKLQSVNYSTWAWNYRPLLLIIIKIYISLISPWNGVKIFSTKRIKISIIKCMSSPKMRSVIILLQSLTCIKVWLSVFLILCS